MLNFCVNIFEAVMLILQSAHKMISLFQQIEAWTCKKLVTIVVKDHSQKLRTRQNFIWLFLLIHSSSNSHRWEPSSRVGDVGRDWPRGLILVWLVAAVARRRKQQTKPPPPRQGHHKLSRPASTPTNYSLMKKPSLSRSCWKLKILGFR